MRKKKRTLPQSSKASASSESLTLCSPDTALPCNSTQEPKCSENDQNSPQEPQPGTSTGGDTPSAPQLNTSTRGSVRSAAKGRVYKEYDSSDTSSSDSDSGDDDVEWRPDSSTVPLTARKTNNPSG